MTVPPSLVAFANCLADESATIIKQHSLRQLNVQVKADKSLVTSLDLEIETHLRKMIQTHYPDHGVLGEEFAPENLQADWIWVLDPIDGTVAYMAGMSVYSTLIALCYKARPVVGVMHFCATNERWVGVTGQTTTLNGLPCSTRKLSAINDAKTNVDVLHDAIQSSSSPDFFSAGYEQSVLQKFRESTAWRVYGGAAMSYGRLTSGKIDVALDAGLKIHDYAPFVPIIEGAGGVITDWQGQSLTLSSGPRILAAGDATRHAAALHLIASLNHLQSTP
jgi:inositol-phosphate phosphatase / L-galactose 1-phosphate phosphatase / histidinol-phosphatase